MEEEIEKVGEAVIADAVEDELVEAEEAKEEAE